MHFLWMIVSSASLAHLFLFCGAQEDAGPDFFTAAVFEHRHRHTETDSPNEAKRKNLHFFEKAAEEASKKGADIIVFNEYGLLSYSTDRDEVRKYAEHVPEPTKQNFNPCEEMNKLKDSPVLVTFSCMAKKHKIYVVGNMVGKQPCDSTSQTCDADDLENCDSTGSKCPADQVFLYNTNVAFNREGRLIARYYKLHPYLEVVNTPETHEYSFFTTEFGVFGMVVCFDSYFKESVNLVEKYKVETIIFSTYWFDDVCPFHSVEFQQGWALSNGANFLASNIHLPGTGSLGSGIYSKYYGALKYSYNPDGQSKLLVAKVPRTRSSEPFPNERTTEITVITEDAVRDQEETGENFPRHCYDKIVGKATDDGVDYRCFKQKLARYSVKKLETPSGVLEECHNGMCCSISYSAESMEEDFYLIVFNGTNEAVNFYFWCEENCLLVRCDPFEEKPCALLSPESKTVFHTLEMKASFTAQRILPAVTKTRYRFAPKSEWTFETAGNSATLKFKSQSRVPLLKAGFFGRCYDRDPPFKPWY